MADVKWIKIVTDVFDNRKIKQIEKLPEADAIINIWFRILCLAGNINEYGKLLLTKEVPYTDEMLSNEFNKSIEIIRLALQVFVRFEMIEIIDNIYYISNWEKYQNTEGLEKIREQTRLRVEKHRKNQKLLKSNAYVTLRNATDIDIDIDIDKDIDIKENIKRKNFTKPTIEEIKNYCTERNNKINPNKFYDFYESKGWKIGKAPMKDWKACIRTWEQKDTNNINCKKYEQRKDTNYNDFYDN